MEFDEKNKKMLSIIMIMSFLFVCGLWIYITNFSYISTFRFAIKANWKMDLPKPYKEKEIASNLEGYPLKGNTYVIMDYKENLDKVNTIIPWKEKDEKIPILSKTFINDVIKSRTINNKTKNKIKENFPKIEKNFKYYYTNDNKDWILFILNPKEKKIYIMECRENDNTV